MTKGKSDGPVLTDSTAERWLLSSFKGKESRYWKHNSIFQEPQLSPIKGKGKLCSLDGCESKPEC